MNQIKKIIKYLLGTSEDKFSFLPRQTRADDIYLTSFPRSGVTYLSFIIANGINEYLQLGLNINFFNVNFFVYDIHSSREIPPQLEHYPFRRLIKSHANYNPFYKNIILLIRDPRDAMRSYYHYTKGVTRFQGDFSAFLRDKKFGIAAWVNHTKGWLEKSSRHQNLYIMSYEKLRREPATQIKWLFELFGCGLSDEQVKKIIEKTNFEFMRELEEKTQSYTSKKLALFQFVREGKIKGGTELDEPDHRYIKEIAGDLMFKLEYE